MTDKTSLDSKNTSKLSFTEARGLMQTSYHSKGLIRDLFAQNPELKPAEANNDIKEIIGSINQTDFDIVTDMILEKAKTNPKYANIYMKLIETGRIGISGHTPNNDIYDKLISEYGFTIRKLAVNNILSKDKLIYIEKMISMYPHREKLLAKNNFSSIIAKEFYKSVKLYDAKDHRSLLDQYIYTRMFWTK